MLLVVLLWATNNELNVRNHQSSPVGELNEIGDIYAIGRIKNHMISRERTLQPDV